MSMIMLCTFFMKFKHTPKFNNFLQARLKEQIPLDDLMHSSCDASTSGVSTGNAAPLVLTRSERYLHGPTEFLGDR